MHELNPIQPSLLGPWAMSLIAILQWRTIFFLVRVEDDFSWLHQAKISLELLEWADCSLQNHAIENYSLKYSFSPHFKCFSFAHVG